VVAARRGRTRDALGLEPPHHPNTLVLASLAAVPLLLALAAAGPAIRSPAGRAILDSTEAIFVFDVSGSMGAAAGPHAPTRLAQAKAVAISLRDAVPDARAGVSSITTQLLPELFPTADESAFAGTVAGALGVLKPPPPALQQIATTFDPLATLRDQGFFDPSTKHRVAILLTDGETTTYFPQNVGQRLTAAVPPSSTFGRPRPIQAPVALLVVRFGGPGDRIYRPDGTIDPGYRPEFNAPAKIAELAQDTHGLAFDARSLQAARVALQAAVGAGPSSTKTTAQTTTRLAPYVALLALAPLGFLVWRRNLVSL
jgi:hypothetical protein